MKTKLSLFNSKTTVLVSFLFLLLFHTKTFLQTFVVCATRTVGVSTNNTDIITAYTCNTASAGTVESSLIYKNK